MKALVCTEYGSFDELAVRELPAPSPAAGQVRVRVEAASMNYPDALMVLGRYQFKPPLPCVPGGELAGTVTAVGEGVTRLREGDRVLAVPSVGAFAEEALVDARLALPLPAGVDAAEAAALPTTYGTMYHALLDRARLQAGESLLVLGAGGGIGIATVELGRKMGATVIAAASSAAKLGAARGRGAQHGIDYAAGDLRAQLKAIVGERGVDVVCDPVGGPYSEPALRSTAWGGRFLVVGFAAGEIPRIPLNLVLLKGCAIVGVFWGGFLKQEPKRGAEQLAQLVEWLREGSLRPLVSRRIALDETAATLRDIHARGAVGKIVVVP